MWLKFKAEMNGSDTDRWLYEGENIPPGIPADLGYWMGYKITKSYYDKAHDKRAAIKAILLFKDAKAFLKASGFNR